MTSINCCNRLLLGSQALCMAHIPPTISVIRGRIYRIESRCVIIRVRLVNSRSSILFLNYFICNCNEIVLLCKVFLLFYNSQIWRISWRASSLSSSGSHASRWRWHVSLSTLGPRSIRQSSSTHSPILLDSYEAGLE
jgi:hypothetical protein